MNKYNFDREQGLTLLEIIVALAVLGIGMLGVAHLQVTGARFNTGSYARTQATVLASSIIDQIRSHGSDSVTEFDTESSDAGTCDPLGTSPDNAVLCWKSALAEKLPGGSGTITVANDSGRTHVAVVISWTEIQAANTQNDNTENNHPIEKSITMGTDI